eukprot:7552079-Alexandrium_andersonii.AAC.1
MPPRAPPPRAAPDFYDEGLSVWPYGWLNVYHDFIAIPVERADVRQAVLLEACNAILDEAGGAITSITAEAPRGYHSYYVAEI